MGAANLTSTDSFGCVFANQLLDKCWRFRNVALTSNMGLCRLLIAKPWRFS